MAETRKCVVCGKEFEAVQYKKKTCGPECAHKYHLQYVKDHTAEKNKNDYQNQKKRKREKKVKKSRTQLSDINRQAREHGMTYGKYVGYLYTKKETEERKIDKEV